METEAPESARELPSPYPPGTVRINDDRVTFHNDYGLELEAVGVHATRTNRHLEGIAPGVTTQTVVIHRLVGKLPNSGAPRFVIDWLGECSLTISVVRQHREQRFRFKQRRSRRPSA